MAGPTTVTATVSSTAIFLLVLLITLYFSAAILFSIHPASAAEVDSKYDFNYQEDKTLLNGKHMNIGTIEVSIWSRIVLTKYSIYLFFNLNIYSDLIVQFAPTVYIEHDANGKISRVDGIGILVFHSF